MHYDIYNLWWIMYSAFHYLSNLDAFYACRIVKAMHMEFTLHGI